MDQQQRVLQKDRVEGRIEDSDRAIIEGALAPRRVCVLEGIVEYDVVSCH